MKNKKVRVILIIVFIIALIVVSLFIANEIIKVKGSTFKATILEVNKLKSIDGDPLILVEGLSTEKDYRGQFCLVVEEKTVIKSKGNKIDVSELSEGDTISITFTDEYLYTMSPCTIYEVTLIKLLEKAK